MRNKEVKTIDLAYNPLDNSIGFMRFVFASIVVIQHAFALNNITDPLTEIGFTNFGQIGVNGFFILSGYLITSSWINSKSFVGFTWRRVLRIFPAFWACLVITAFIIAPILAVIINQSFDWFFLKQQLLYIFKNSLLIINQPDIASLLQNHPQQSLNGSFWTLSWEFGFYIFLSIAGIIGLLTKRKEILIVVFCIYVLSYWASDCKCVIFFKYYTSERVAILPFMFGLGMLGYLFKNRLPNNKVLFILCILGWILDVKYNDVMPLYPFFFLYIILWLMVNLPIRSFEKNGDYSYGIYIYHFPLIQITLLLFSFNINPWLLSLIVIIPTGIMAYLSWHFIEKPALSLKRYFK